MATTTSPSASRTNRPTYSCIRCSDRKVKCDRQTPCSACVKHRVECVFNLAQPPRQRKRRVKDQILTDRLKHYESILQQQGIDPSKPPQTQVVPKDFQLHTPSSIESEPSGCINKVQVVYGQGRSTFVENSLWTRVVEEFHDPEDALEDSSNSASDSETSEEDLEFVLSSQPKSKTMSRHPSPERIYQLWQIFVENVDPLTKVVHVPTLRPAIQKAVSNIGTIPRSFEALMFAIYSAAVMSLKDDECQQNFGEPRKTLLSRYISATKAALSRAKFMGTISLVVLQALVLHLLSIRNIHEPRAVWSLTGVAVRIAQAIGLERDGESLGLPPFEAEMRRRIWWLLKTHDFRAAELCGLAKFREFDTGAESTKWPINVNDNELYPGMSSLPVESNSLTDMIFIATKCEFANFAAGRIARFRQQGKIFNEWTLNAKGSDKEEMNEAFRQAEETLETKYLRYCDPSRPLHLLTMLVVRLAMNNIRFLTHHPRRWASIEQTPLSERQWIWEVSTKLLEQQNMIQSNPQIKQFAWHALYFLQWHVFIHVLDTLRANPLIADAEKAWQIIANLYENNPDVVLDTRKPIHVAVGNLCLKSYSAREAALRNGNMYTPPTPGFILQLRQQRELAKAKRQARDTKSTQTHVSVGQSQAVAREVRSSDTLEATHLQQTITSNPPYIPQPGRFTESDPFWLINGLGDSQVGTFDNAINTDLDFMLTQDQSGVEDNAAPTITWEQWDAWLADSNMIRPLSSARDWRAGA